MKDKELKLEETEACHNWREVIFFFGGLSNIPKHNVFVIKFRSRELDNLVLKHPNGS